MVVQQVWWLPLWWRGYCFQQNGWPKWYRLFMLLCTNFADYSEAKKFKIRLKWNEYHVCTISFESHLPYELCELLLSHRINVTLLNTTSTFPFIWLNKWFLPKNNCRIPQDLLKFQWYAISTYTWFQSTAKQLKLHLANHRLWLLPTCSLQRMVCLS